MKCSVVLPIYNESAILPVLYQRLTEALSGCPHECELIFVNDGSADESLRLLKEFHQRDGRVKIVSFTRNFGHQVALSAGLRYATGDAVILMDGDLQDPPEVLPRLITKWEEGWDVVFAVRRRRKESPLKRLAYWSFYRIAARLARPPIPVDAGDFSILSRRAVDLLNRMPERTRFLRGLRSWTGLKHASLEYERDRRWGGRPKFTLPKLVLLALDGLVAFSHGPLRLASMLGFACALLGTAGIAVFLYLRLFTNVFITGYTSMIIVILFMGSIQLITIGILGEYVARIYEEVKQRPLYVVDELVGLSGSDHVDESRGTSTPPRDGGAASTRPAGGS